MTSRPSFSRHGDAARVGRVRRQARALRPGLPRAPTAGWAQPRSAAARDDQADQGGGHRQEAAARPRRTTHDGAAGRARHGRRRGPGRVRPRRKGFRSDTMRPGSGATGRIGASGPQSGCATAPVHCAAVRVDQVIPSLASRDAIGVHTLNLRDGLRAAGIDSDVYYGSLTPDVEHEGRPVTELGRAGRDRGCCTRHPSAARSTTSWPRAPSPSW